MHIKVENGRNRKMYVWEPRETRFREKFNGATFRLCVRLETPPPLPLVRDLLGAAELFD